MLARALVLGLAGWITTGSLWGDTLNCSANYAATIPLRRTAVTEQIGDLDAVCTGGTSGTAHDVTVTVSLSVPVTSANATGSKTDAMLFLNITDKALIAPGQNAFVGDLEPSTAGSSYSHTVRFSGVRIAEPGGVMRLKIANLRANIAALPYGASAWTPIYATVDTSPRLPGFPLKYAAGYLLGSGPAVTTSTSQTPGYQMEVRVEEASSLDFRPRTYAGQDQLAIGGSTLSESGLITTAFQPLGLSSAGLADSGTRILLRFSNVSVGQQVFVSTRPIASGISGVLDARLTAATDEGGGGAYAEVSPTSVTPSPGIAPVTIVNGRGTAVYEVIQSDPTGAMGTEWAKFGVVLQGGTGQPTVEVMYGPLTTTTQTWIPRFSPPRTAPAIVPTGVFRDTFNQIRLLEHGNSELFNAGGVFQGKPGVAQDSDGSTWIVARDTANGLWTTRFTAATKTFDSWTFLGGQTQSDPSVTVSDDGEMYYTIRDQWNNCWLGTFRRGVGNTWQYLGGVFSADPQVAWSPTGILTVAGRDNWGGVWIRYLYTTLNGAVNNSPWLFRGGIIQGQFSLSQQAPYTLLAARDLGNGLWFARMVPSYFEWIGGQGTIERGPQLAGPIAVGAVADNVWARQIDATQGTLTPWKSIGGVVKSEGPAWLNNELYVVGRDGDNSIWWHRSSTGQWVRAGHTGVAASEISAAPR